MARFGTRLLITIGIFQMAYSTVAALVVLPEKPVGYVNDYAAIISTSTRIALEETLTSFTASTSNEIAVVTVPSLGGETIEHYASLLFSKWKIGQAKKDNGVLLLISRDDRTARIEVGYGLEGAVPDLLASSILKEKLIPQFKLGHVDEGVTGTVTAIMESTQGEYQGAGLSSGGPHVSFDLIMLLGIFGIQGLAFLSSIFARSKSWWAGGVVGAVLGALATGFHIFGLSVMVGLTITFFLTIFGFLFDFLVSNAYNSGKSTGAPIPWWAGGNTGGWRSSSGGTSFRGFGGGRSGGGGASGSW